MSDRETLQAAEILAYVTRETGRDISPIMERRAELWAIVAGKVQEFADAPPSVDTDKSVKQNPDWRALVECVTQARGLLRELEAPVIAHYAARAAEQPAEGESPDEQARRMAREAMKSANIPQPGGQPN
jgi:hypothetical protein